MAYCLSSEQTQPVLIYISFSVQYKNLYEKSYKESERHNYHNCNDHHNDLHDDHQGSRTKGNVSTGLFSLRCCGRPFKSDSLSL